MWLVCCIVNKKEWAHSVSHRLSILLNSSRCRRLGHGFSLFITCVIRAKRRQTQPTISNPTVSNVTLPRRLLQLNLCTCCSGTPDAESDKPLRKSCKAPPKRIMYKVAGLIAVPGALGLMSGTVHAASEEKHDTTLKTNELSLYTVPQQKFSYVVPEAGRLEQSVTLWRKAAEPYTTWCQQTGLAVSEKAQGVYREVKPKVERSVQFGKDGCEYLRDPPSGFYPRVGVIGFAGILGVFLARGSRIKKLIYPTGLMALGTSMYYPKQAASVAKVAGDAVYEWSLQGYAAVENVWKGKPTTKQSEKEERKDSSTASKD